MEWKIMTSSSGPQKFFWGLVSYHSPINVHTIRYKQIFNILSHFVDLPWHLIVL